MPLSERGPRFDTPGRNRLSSWKQDKNLNQTELARLLGGNTDAANQPVDPSTVSRWLSGASRPDTVFQVMLERITGGLITCHHWLTSDERGRVARNARRALRDLRKKDRGATG